MFNGKTREIQASRIFTYRADERMGPKTSASYTLLDSVTERMGRFAIGSFKMRIRKDAADGAVPRQIEKYH